MKPGRPSLPPAEKAVPFSVRLTPSRKTKLATLARKSDKTAGRIISELIDSLPAQK